MPADTSNEKDPLFITALREARETTTDGLLIIMNAVRYEAYGHEVVMLWKTSDNMWHAGLRNNKDMEAGNLRCESYSPKEALALLYAFCRLKGYIAI